ncbi:TPA_asm: polyprotein [Cupressus virus 1]|uniref:Replicase n=1 Tax=Cupressus virus 1 TaxID=2977965 RepID=A0A9N6YJD2_9RHAB|nr:TPA_asm: polyprotein [Cupressus virus 1]
MNFSDLFDDISSEDEEREEIKDEKLMCDLHLNSALNIDALKHANGEDLKYNVHKDKRVKEKLSKAKEASIKIQNCLYPKTKLMLNPLIGAVELKAELVMLDQEDEDVCDDVFDELLESLQSVFENRDFHMDFGRIRSELRDRNIKLPSGLLYRFQTTMNLCLAVSEQLRGGNQIIMDGSPMRSISGFIYSPIRSSGKKDGFLATDGSVVIISLDGVGGITIWEDLLALLDTLGQRICSFISHSVGELIGEKGAIGSKKHKQVLHHFDKALKTLGNPAYKLIGMFETLCVGILLEKNPDAINDPLQLSMNMFNEVQEIIEEYNMPTEETINMFNTLYALLATLDNNQLSNIFCEYRIWGHPYVDIYKGMKKVQDVGCKVKVISPYYPTYMTRIFKEFIVTGHYRKYKSYPRGLCQDRLDNNSYITKQILSNKTIEKYAPGYLIEDWDKVTLQKIFNIPSSYDITHILNDKAISPKLSQLTQAAVEGKQLSSMDGRRGIIAWLMGNTISCNLLLAEISEKGISIEDCVIGMYEKEREMKIEARMFALMSETMRYYFVVTEGLIADHILKFFPQITMKDSLNKLQKRMWTAGTRGSGRYDVNVNIDFSKWNTNMRAELMTPLFREMDKVFGLTDVISRTHEIFTSSMIYSCSGKFQPETCEGKIVENGPMCYRGHLGGMEGLRQKGWTVGTVCLIEQVSRMVGIRYNLMGQGDNQIIKLKMDEKRWRDYEWTEDQKIQEANRLTECFVTTLERVFSEVGLPVKPKECWRSHKLFMYGKSMIMDNDTLAQWQKKLLRSYALSNEGVLTIGGTIGTIATNCMSSCMTMTRPELGYAMFLYLGLWTLRFLTQYHPFTRTKNLLSKREEFKLPNSRGRKSAGVCSFFEFSIIALMIPSACGGSINIPFTSYIIRGFPDPASEAYSWLKLLGESKNRHISSISRNFYSYLQPSVINIEQLAKSPLSINHVKVLSPSLSAKKESTEFLRKNFSYFNNVVSMDEKIQAAYSTSALEDKLITDPVNPLLYSELIQNFPNKVSEDLLSRVKSTRTIKKLAMKCSSTPIIRRIQQGESSFIAYLCWRKGVKGDIFSECATQQVRILRNIGWGRKIQGVTTPHPLEMCVVDCIEGNRCHIPHDYVYVMMSSNGGFTPYLGSSVKNKVSSVGDENVRTEPLLNRIMMLASYANWMKLGQNYKNLIRELGDYYGGSEATNAINDEFNAAGNYAGAVEHRFLTSMMSDGCFINYAPQIGSRVYMSTDNMVTYGRGNTNYTLHFQALFGFFQYMIQKTNISHHGHIHIVCNTCVIPVNDDVPDIGVSDGLLIQAVRGDILSVLGVRVNQKIDLSGTTDITMPQILQTALSVDRLDKRYIRNSLTAYTGLKIAIELVGDSITDTEEMSTGIADLQKFPRIYGKKIYQDELLHYVCLYSIIMSGLYKQLSLNGRGLERVKRYLVDRISHISKDKLASLASMMIGDNLLNPVGHFLVDSIGSMCPISLNEHIYGSRTTLVRKIQSVGTIEYFGHPTVLYLPKNDVSELELSIVYIGHDLLINRSQAMYNSYIEIQSLENMLRSNINNERSIRRTLSAVRILEGSLDRAYKLVNAIVTPKLTLEHTPMIFTSNWETILKRMRPKKTTVEVKADIPTTKSVRAFREISLPTSAIYKWKECLNDVNISKYNIMMGDGTGSTSFAIAEKDEKAIIFPMALFERKDIIPQDLTSLCPKISRLLSNVHNTAMLSIPDDINDPLFVDMLDKFCESFNKEEITLYSDIEMEGGSILKTNNIVKILKIGIRLILKVYIQELHDTHPIFNLRFNDIRLLVSELGNVDYGEVFLMITPGDNHYFHRCDLINTYNRKVRTLDFDAAIELTRQVTENNTYLAELSFNLALRHIDNLGVVLDRNILELDASELLTYLVVYINTHYSFRTESIDISGERRIVPGKRRQLERLFQIILLSTSTEIDQEKLTQLKIMHKKDGHTMTFPYKNGPCLVIGHHTSLGKKDKQVVRCIQCRRDRLFIRKRFICDYEGSMSDVSTELLGFLSRLPISEMIYRCSGTFESGSSIQSEEV